MSGGKVLESSRVHDVAFSLVDILALLVAIVLGSMVFFSFVMAPLIFTNLPAEISGPFIRQVFPAYYLALAIATAAAAAVGFGDHRLEAFVLLAVCAGFVLARQLLMPAINRHREQLRGEPGAGQSAFGLLHRLSVALNYVQLAAIVFVLVRVVD